MDDAPSLYFGYWSYEPRSLELVAFRLDCLKFCLRLLFSLCVVVFGHVRVSASARGYMCETLSVASYRWLSTTRRGCWKPNQGSLQRAVQALNR